MTADPRERMIRSAALLIREGGVEATSFADVLAHSEAPRGSIYHHFPRGKAQLVEEATRWAGEFFADFEAAALSDGDPVAGLRKSIAFWREVLEDRDFCAGCPVVAVTVEGSEHDAARQAAAVAFQSWIDPYAHALEDSGLAPERARSLATLVVSAMEGGIILARAQRSLEPFDRATESLVATVSDAVRGSRARTGSGSER